MKITFHNTLDIEETMCFEELFEPELRLEADEKRVIINHGYVVWMKVDGWLAGETYGITPSELFRKTGDRVPDTDPADVLSVYCYTTSILPRYQGLRLAPILMAYFQGYLRTLLRKKLIGHATSGKMHSLREMFGAHFTGSVHENWCGSKRVAEYYEQTI
jgi:hypothetical protein